MRAAQFVTESSINGEIEIDCRFIIHDDFIQNKFNSCTYNWIERDVDAFLLFYSQI